ncbi:MAG: methyl-accepting chemotaxis protein [Oscillospiraceae bacterium]
MSWFKNQKIRVKLMVSFLIVALLAGFIGVTGIINLVNVRKNARVLYENATVPIADLAGALESYQENRVELRNLVLLESANEIQSAIDTINTRVAQIQAIMDDYEKTLVEDSGRQLFAEFTSHYNHYLTLAEEIMGYARNGNKAKATAALFSDEMLQSASDVHAAMTNLFSRKVEGGKSQYDLIVAASVRANITMMILSVAGMLLAGILGIFIARMISRPITQLVSAADQIALGDVNIDIAIDTNDEVGSLAASFAKMVENIRNQALSAEQVAAGDLTIEVPIRSANDLLGHNLAEMVQKNHMALSKVHLASEQVAVGSKQVSDSSILLSQGAAEQSSTIEELAASIQQLSAQTEWNAKNADQANELTEDAKSNAQQGYSLMHEMLGAMDEISESSSKISKIIQVIDDIAFQTNILALNAAVEAARAGQHGKGFAVVAEEVRNLAARSANAAKDTTIMIENSIKKSEDGSKIAHDTAQALDKIVAEIEQIATLVSGIASASNEQAVGIKQINEGITQVSQVVQSNSATAEEIAAASEELHSQAELLKETVNQYKLQKGADTKDTYEGALRPETTAHEETSSKMALSGMAFEKY